MTAKNWFVKYAAMSTALDDYEQGEVGAREFVWEAKSLGLARTLDEVAALVRAHGPDVPDAAEKDSWIVFEDGRLETSFMVDVDNMNVDKDEDTLAVWKQRAIKLWSAYVDIYLIDPQTEKPGKASVLAKQFKIPMY